MDRMKAEQNDESRLLGQRLDEARLGTDESAYVNQRGLHLPIVDFLCGRRLRSSADASRSVLRRVFRRGVRVLLFVRYHGCSLSVLRCWRARATLRPRACTQAVRTQGTQPACSPILG